MDGKLFGAWFDEAERGNILVLGGFFAPFVAVNSLVSDWRNLKKSLGLEPWAEVKWKLSQKHPTRRQLEKASHTTRELSKKAVETIATWPTVTGLVAVMIETRREETTRMIKDLFGMSASVRDFYCEALEYLLQRLAEEAEEDQWDGCFVACDTPGLGKGKLRWGKLWREPAAHYKKYKNCFEVGPGHGPGKRFSEKSLCSLGFYPSLLIADATFDDMLQIADVIVGCIADWVGSVSNGDVDPWLLGLAKKMAGILRSQHGSPNFWGDGLILWPPQSELRRKLQQSIQDIELDNGV